MKAQERARARFGWSLRERIVSIPRRRAYPSGLGSNPAKEDRKRAFRRWPWHFRRATAARNAQSLAPSCMRPRTYIPENECSRSGAADNDSECASGNASARMRSKRARNCSRVIRPAGRGESVRRNSSRPGFDLPEPMHFENDPVRSLFLEAYYSPRQIFLVGPQVNERLFSRAPHFILKIGEPGKPLAVFTNFHGA